MPYTQLFYHLIWTTKNRQPLLTPTVEAEIYGYLRAKAVGLGATLYMLNGVEDHVHLVVSIPAKIAISKFIGQVKAVASTKYNKAHPDDPPFFWQEEYGAYSFDRKRLPNFIAYVEDQKSHHRNNKEIPILERVAGETRWLHEPGLPYAINDSDWRVELENME